MPWIVPARWPDYAVVLAVLTLVWPLHIALAEGVEIYLPVTWTAAASVYVLGAASLPVLWLAALLGFGLMIALDAARLVPADGIAAENVRRWRGEPFDAASVADGDLSHVANMGENAVRVAVLAALGALAPVTPRLLGVVVAEGTVALWLRVVPIPGRSAPRRVRARIAAALGRDVLLATDLLRVVMVTFLLLADAYAGVVGFAVASGSTVVLYAILKRLNDARVESERRRLELMAMRDELDRRERLAAIGQTASTVFHQIGRQHGVIGMFAHLLTRGAEPAVVCEHARRILASVEEANRVIEELLRFGEDRALNLYTHSVRGLVEECVGDCRPRAGQRGVALELRGGPDARVALDKHKLKQALGNVLDNAIDVTPRGGRVEVEARADAAGVRISVRDHGPGIPEALRARLFTPFVTTKARGIGLGLVLAKELVEAHGGTIGWTAAEPGTTFVLTLPREPGRGST